MLHAFLALIPPTVSELVALLAPPLPVPFVPLETPSRAPSVLPWTATVCTPRITFVFLARPDSTSILPRVLVPTLAALPLVASTLLPETAT